MNKGEVTLTGTVNERFEKRRAEDITEEVSGVRHVENRIRIGSSQSVGQNGTSSSGVSRDSVTSNDRAH